jgi:hypothetical protein
MKHRLTLVVVAALVVLGGFALTAALIPSGCPSGWHDLASGGCETDGTHLAPSSGVSIPDATMLRPEQRWGFRGGIIVVGVFLAGGILWLGLKDRRDVHDPVSASATASAD